jgi:hypothetical protein
VYGAQFGAAETILARPITIAPQLRHSGWTTATPIDTTIVRLPAALQADEGETIRKTLPIMAHGPVGLGYVTILTADPSLAAANPSGETARRVWLAALAPGLEDYLSLPIVPAAAAYQQWGGWTGGTSGGNDMQSRAITQSLNALADQPGRNLDPITVLIALLACALLLTILLGPLDGLVLHAKRKMHMSWATALFWIVAVSVVAGFVPSFLRGNLPTMRITNVVDDVVIDHGGAAGWRTTLHGLFASQPGSRPLIAQPDAPTSGSAFRGVAVGEYWNTSTPIFTPIGLVQSSTLSSRGSEVSVWTLPISQGQWSFRNAMSIGPISTGEDRMPIRARAIRVDAYTLRIEVEGTPLPPPAVCTILSGEVRRSGSRTASSLDLLGTPGELSFTRTKSILDGTLPAYTESPVESTFPPLEYQFGNAQTERRPYGSFQDLPGIQRHELAIEARLATGRWALITLNCKIEIPTSSPGEEELQIQTRTFRLLVPIEGSATPPSDSGATP